MIFFVDERIRLNTLAYMDDNSVPVTFRLPEETVAQLDEMARRTFRKRADLIRLAVDSILRDGSEVETGEEAAQ